MDQETAWAWLGDVYARFKTWERASLNATVVNARAVQAKAEDRKAEDRQAATAAQQADPTTKGKGPASREQPANPEAERTQQRASVVKDVVALGTLRNNVAQLFMP